MTGPVLPTTTAKLGPGSLTIGSAGTSIDVSCLLNNARVSASKDQTDDVTKLCGAVSAGKIDYTYSIGGNIDIDVAIDDGLFALSQNSAGSQQDFTFIPNTEVNVSVSGKLTIDPLDFGADEYGDDLTSDFEWSIVGKPVYTWPAGP